MYAAVLFPGDKAGRMQAAECGFARNHCLDFPDAPGTAGSRFRVRKLAHNPRESVRLEAHLASGPACGGSDPPEDESVRAFPRRYLQFRWVPGWVSVTDAEEHWQPPQAVRNRAV